VVIRRTILFTVVMLVTFASVAGAPTGQEKPVSTGPSPSDVIPLIIDTPLTHEMNGGEAHTYRVTITSGQYLRVLVNQQGIDVVVSLVDPKGQKVLEVDSPNGNRGPEPLSIIAETSGKYLIDVRSPDKTAKPGRYGINLEALRVPAPADRDRVAAESKFGEALKLSQQQTATSRRQAIEKYEQALPLFRALNDRPMETYALNLAGLLYHSFGELPKALEYYSRALPISRATGDAVREASLLNNIGSVYDILGEPHKALEHFEQAQALWQKLDLRDPQGNTLNNIGLVYFNLGELQKALEYYNQALPLRRAGSNRGREADTLDNLGQLYVALGELPRALEQHQQALNLRQSVKDIRGEANTRHLIGFAYAASGNMAKAQEYFNQALPMWKAVGDRRGESFSLRYLGIVHSAPGSYERALEYLQQALELQRALKAQREQSITLHIIGDVYGSSGQLEKAMSYYKEALPLSQAVGDSRIEANILQGMARVEVERGELVVARQHIEAAISKIERVRGQVDIQLRASYLGAEHNAYPFYIDLLMRMHRLNPSDENDAAALRISEQAHARSFLEMLSESRIDIRQGIEAALLERERLLSQQINAKAERLIQALGQNAKERAAVLRREIAELDDQYQQAQAAIRKSSPAYAALTQPKPLGLKEIQAELDQGTVLLEYSLGEEHSYVWAVTRDSLKTYELPKREQIEKSARLVYDLLTARSQSKAGEDARQKQVRIAQADANLINASKELSQMVLDPLSSELRAERLVVVADGALQYVPFSALSVVSDQLSVAPLSRTNNGLLANYRPLMLDHEVISLPSASSLAIQREGLRNRKPAPNSVAVIADPVFSAADERLGRAHVKAAIQTQGDLLASTRIIEHLADDSGLIIRRLKFTRQEADQILAEAPPGKTLRAIDFKANRATATAGELSKYRYVHFATHGYIDSERPDLSAIVLSLVDEQGKPQDGFLRTHDIYNLNLPAELVVLSACETGLGKEIKGEGLVGLTQGFMYAGARRVVVSLWNVNDKATAELMARFYRGMLREKKSPAAALRAAQVEMSQQKQWQAPYYWAAFTLQGEWR
jgi:CHAT domain-containing protein/Tfp pilus assembly protein PilF